MLFLSGLKRQKYFVGNSFHYLVELESLNTDHFISTRTAFPICCGSECVSVRIGEGHIVRYCTFTEYFFAHFLN